MHPQLHKFSSSIILYLLSIIIGMSFCKLSRLAFMWMVQKLEKGWPLVTGEEEWKEDMLLFPGQWKTQFHAMMIKATTVANKINIDNNMLLVLNHCNVVSNYIVAKVNISVFYNWWFWCIITSLIAFISLTWQLTGYYSVTRCANQYREWSSQWLRNTIKLTVIISDC